jgi:hypothetical protein
MTRVQILDSLAAHSWTKRPKSLRSNSNRGAVAYKNRLTRPFPYPRSCVEPPLTATAALRGDYHSANPIRHGI